MKYGCSRAYLAVRRFSGFQFKRHSRRFMESSSSLKIIVGNKCDLVDKRKVETKELEATAKQWNVNFMEVSALEKINVKETFLVVAKQLLVKKAKIESDEKVEGQTKKRCYCF